MAEPLQHGEPPVSPYPPRREGDGETRFPHPPTAVGAPGAPQAGAWGTPGSPYPPRRKGDGGNPVSQSPNRGWERLAPHRQGHGEPRVPRTLPAGRGVGKPGFPMSQPRLGAPGAPTGRGMGNPGFPVCSHQNEPENAARHCGLTTGQHERTIACDTTRLAEGDPGERTA